MLVNSNTDCRFLLKVKRQEAILNCLAVGVKHKESYTPAVRNFCISMNNTSPAAYRLLRNEFDNRIPAPVTLRAWHANADINANAGILHQPMEILKKKAEEKAAENDVLTGALLFDEMSIRKHLQWSNNQMVGFEKKPGLETQNVGLAKDVLVFMFSEISDSWQIPVAYYYIASITGEEKTELIRTIIGNLHEVGVKITNITFDGHKTNLAASDQLGADLNVFSNTFDPSFNIDGTAVNIILDPSHMIKLIRNSIAGSQIHDAENKPIKWVYFERLVRFERRRNFGSMHKMTQGHIDYHSNEMNVKLAVQTLSASTANAMEFLLQKGHSEFKGAEPTIKLIRIFNDIFDVFNSTKSTISTAIPLKRKISRENVEQILLLFDEANAYVKGLKLRNKSGKLTPLCSSVLKTGFMGAVVNMASLKAMYERLIESNQIATFPTHYLSQDHLEAFFAKIRSFKYNGDNRHQTCQQFDAAMRKILANTSIYCSNKVNCTILDQPSAYNPYSNISIISSRRPQKGPMNMSHFTPDDIENVVTELSKIQSIRPNSQSTDLSALTISHVAASIESSIVNSVRYACDYCKQVFEENEKVDEAFTSRQYTRKACRSTFEICNTADYFMKLELLRQHFDFGLIYHSIRSSLRIEELYCESDFSHCPSHKVELVENILKEYIKYKGNYLARNVSLSEAEKRMRETMERFVHNNR